MTDELYINNTRVDMDDSGVYMDYTSGILEGLDSIKSNYSYSIKLPKTATNLRVIDGLYYPSSASEFPSRRNAASLYRDGVTIVSNATLNLLAVNEDDIEVSLSWGIADLLENVDDVELCDLYASDETFAWSISKPSYGGYPALPCPVAQYGERRSVVRINNQDIYRPVVAASDVLSRIQERVGNAIVFSDDVASVLDSYYIPILQGVVAPSEVEGDIAVIGGEGVSDVLLANTSGSYTAASIVWNADSSHSTIYDPASISFLKLEDYSTSVSGYWENWAFGFKRLTSEYTIKVTVSIQFRYTRAGTPQPLNIQHGYFYEKDGEAGYNVDTANPADYSHIFAPVLIQGNQYQYIGDTELQQWQSPTDNAAYFFTCDSAEYMEFTNVDIRFSLVTEDESDDDEEAIPLEICEEGEEYRCLMRYVDNMPSIGCKEFIKGLCGSFGLYPCLVDGKVVLSRYDDLMDFATHYDWSSKICSDSECPSEIAISPDKVGQRNLFLFVDNEDVPDATGQVLVSNRALDSEVDFLTVEFSAGYNTNGVDSDVSPANVPVYTRVAGTGSDWEYDDSYDGCYVFEQSELDGKATLFFHPFNGLLERYWSNVSAMLGSRVVTDMFHLSAVDLHGLDMTRPVYVAKYGRFFALIEVKTKADDMAEVEMLML